LFCPAALAADKHAQHASPNRTLGAIFGAVFFARSKRNLPAPPPTGPILKMTSRPIGSILSSDKEIFIMRLAGISLSDFR
jgi:hypothetical protein